MGSGKFRATVLTFASRVLCIEDNTGSLNSRTIYSIIPQHPHPHQSQETSSRLLAAKSPLAQHTDRWQSVEICGRARSSGSRSGLGSRRSRSRSNSARRAGSLRRPRTSGAAARAARRGAAAGVEAAASGAGRRRRRRRTRRRRATSAGSSPPSARRKGQAARPLTRWGSVRCSLRRRPAGTAE
jgi:hypothetical protein